MQAGRDHWWHEVVDSAANTCDPEVMDAEDLAQALAALHDRLTDKSGAYPQPMLVSQLSYLSSMISGADQRPGLDREYSRHRCEWRIKSHLRIWNRRI